MGFYLNTDTPFLLFQKARRNEIFVDKSLLIEALSARIHTGDQYVCITRPRRFGKTINALMLGAYYTRGFDSHTLFEGLNIADRDIYRKHLNQYNVIYVDFSRMPFQCSTYSEYITSIYKNMEADLVQAYPFLMQRKYDDISRMFLDSGESFLFILDEWDSVFYKDFMTDADRNAYLGFLKNLLKDQPYVDLAYMTGVLPIAKYSSGSELNMFDEYNFINDNVYDGFFGFSEGEVRVLCEQHPAVSYEEIRQWYDGYYNSKGESLFNPRSVSRALMRGVCLNYWTETGPMNEIADCIEHNIDEVREDIVKLVAGIPVSIKLKGYSASESQLNSRNEILSAMVVYGFLSYYSGEIRIPNRELMEKYQEVLTRKSMGGEGKPAIILELKAGGTCEDAITQIKDRNYLQKVLDCNEILLVGINYDKAKHHKCRIEKVVRDIR